MTNLTAVGQRLTSRTAVLRATTHALERPDRLPRASIAMLQHGSSLVGAAAAAAARYPRAAALIDEDGPQSYQELWQRSDSLAQALLDEHGLVPGDRVGLLAYNSRFFVEALLAVMKAGADPVLLNTGFATPQVAEAVRDLGVRLVLHGDDFAPGAGEWRCAHVAASALADVPVRSRRRRVKDGNIVMLTSGTTGRPKGASRSSSAGGMAVASSYLARVPLKLRDTQVLPAPLFHGWGLLNLGFGLARSATTILHHRFDPLTALQDLSCHEADVFVVVPQMLQRVLDLGTDALVANPTDRLRVISCSGGPLSASLATRALNRFGPVLYNMYGSTEVAAATLATPRDLLGKPSTVGRPLAGVTVRILDDDGDPVATGQVGHVYVGSQLKFSGYTDGSDKQKRGRLVNSGDVGHFDASGRLYIDGREDDMIVSGGENVYPVEVEELLASHPAVEEVAVVGVPDPQFGQALAAFIVLREGRTTGPDDIREHVKASLARHKVPRQVHFLDALPRNATGKIVRRELPTDQV